MRSGSSAVSAQRSSEGGPIAIHIDIHVFFLVYYHIASFRQFVLSLGRSIATIFIILTTFIITIIINSSLLPAQRTTPTQLITRNTTRCDNRDDLLHLSFTLKISIFSETYISLVPTYEVNLSPEE